LFDDWLWRWSEVVAEEVIVGTNAHRLLFGDDIVEQVVLLRAGRCEGVG
jgi:hypothetical protein